MSRSSMSPGFDQRIADWLEDDPDHAPEPVLSTVLAAFPSIPQRHAWRVPWRTRPLTTMASRLLAGAAVAVLLVGGVLIFRSGGPDAAASPPPPSPSVPPASQAGALVLDARFTSSRYGFAVDYPAAWTIFPASLSWKAGAVNLWGSGINDELKGTDIRFSGAAQALAEGQTPDAWLRAYGSPVAALGGNGGDPATWPKVSIDGLDGRIDIDGGPADGGMVPSGGRMFDAVVVSGRLAYNFNMDGNVDRGTFLAFLATVKLPVIQTLDKTYISALGGYSIGYPAAWTATPATKAWTTGYDTGSYSDHIGTDPALDGTSMKLPAGTTFDAWLAGYDANRVQGTCGRPSVNEDITIDGVLGRLHIHCTTKYLEAVVAKGGRVYVFTMYAPYSRPLFEALVGSVRLTPESAKN